MNRWFVMIALALLVLAPSARSDEIQTLQHRIQEARAQLDDLSAALDQEKDPPKRAALQQKITDVRSLLESQSAAFVAARNRQASLRAQLEALHWHATDVRDRMTAIHNQVEARRKALKEGGNAKHFEAFEPTVDKAAQQMGNALRAVEVLERSRARIEQGELEVSNTGLMEAQDRLQEVRRWMREEEAQSRLEKDIDRTRAGGSPEEIQGLRPGKYSTAYTGENFKVQVEDGDVKLRGRVVDQDGAPIPEVRVGFLRALGVQPGQARIEHLREAARHLQEAGRSREAERLQREAAKLEADLRNTYRVRFSAGDEPTVLDAIRDLHQDVRALRKEVRELKALILESR